MNVDHAKIAKQAEDLILTYARAPYLIALLLWLFSASMYYPAFYGAYEHLYFGETGNKLPLLVVAFLVAFPFLLGGLAFALIRKGKERLGWLAALAPAPLSMMIFQMMALGAIQRDYMQRRDALDRAGAYEAYDENND